jgi:hypothetical protein
MKVCRKCGSPDIAPGQLKHQSYICRSCDSARAVEWQKDNPGKRYESRRRRNGSPKEISEHLRSRHALTRDLSEHWAAILMNPGTRCAICGLPNYVIKTYRERGWPFFLGKRHGRGSAPRLTLDHIVPGCNSGGFRPLCKLCNTLRGANRLTDQEVLIEVRSKWQWFTGPRFLWWLCTSPGVGGRLHRSERCTKRDAQYADGATDQPIPSPPATSTPSPSPTASATSAS